MKESLLFLIFQILGVARKRDVGGYSKLMDKAAKCLHRLFELAPSKKRNYILDQVRCFIILILIRIIPFILYLLVNPREEKFTVSHGTK